MASDPRGVGWIDTNAPLLGRSTISVAATPASTQRRRAETRESGAAVNRVLTAEAFRLWSQGKEFTQRQAAEVFRIDEYTPEKDRTRKAAQLQQLTQGDESIDSFMAVAIPAALELRAPTGRQKEEL